MSLFKADYWLSILVQGYFGGLFQLDGRSWCFQGAWTYLGVVIQSAHSLFTIEWSDNGG